MSRAIFGLVAVLSLTAVGPSVAQTPPAQPARDRSAPASGAAVVRGRVVEAAYFRPPAKALASVREAPAEMLLPIWVLAAATVYFGIDTTLTAGMAERAAIVLIGGVQ